jgi:glycosyltransferase involved in cell wall biosynthesis
MAKGAGQSHGMISVIVPTLNDEARLVSCLAPLVPAAMQGLVRELIVVDAGSTDGTLEIADDAGAEILAGQGWDLGIAKAKGPWLLLLEPAVRLEFGWEAAVQKHITGPRGPARFRLRRSDGAGFLASLQPPKAIARLLLKGGEGGVGGIVGGAGHGIGNRHLRLLDATGWL